MKKIANIIILSSMIFWVGISVLSCSDVQQEVDSINFQQFLRPVQVRFGIVDLDFIDVSWIGSAPLFEVEYALTADFSGEIEKITVSDKKCTLNNLEQGTSYFVRVRAVSGTDYPKASEYSAVVVTNTLAEPSIKNIVGVTEMQYTVDPLEVTTIVTLTWGEEGVEPEAITSVTFTAAGNAPIRYEVTPEEAEQQKKIVDSGLAVSTEYIVRLYRGTTERGSCYVLTKNGPIPFVSGVPEFDFSTTPFSVMVTLTWELYMVPSVNSVTFTKQGSETPVLTEEILPEDLLAKTKLITGLETATTYIVKLLNDGQVVAQTEVKTPNALSPNITVVRLSDNLRSILIDPDRTDSVYLVPGTHTLAAGANTFITKNLVLFSDDKSETVINQTGYMSPVGDFDRLVFKNITFSSATFLIRSTTVNSSSTTFNIENFEIEDCIYKASAAATTLSGIMAITARTEGYSASIKNYLVKNVTLQCKPDNLQAVFAQISITDPYMSFDNIRIINCTVATNGRGILVLSQVDNPVDVTIENCTFYNMNVTDYPLIYPYNTKSLTLTISNSIFHSGFSYRFLETAAGVIPTLNFTNSYFFLGQTPLFNRVVAPDNRGLIEYQGTPQSLFENPDVDPFKPGVSFKIKDPQMQDKNIGDLRW